MFFLPPIASLVLFVITWRADVLSRPLLLGTFVVVGIATQFIAPAFSLPWFAAAFLNVGVAIYLAIRLKVS